MLRPLPHQMGHLLLSPALLKESGASWKVVLSLWPTPRIVCVWWAHHYGGHALFPLDPLMVRPSYFVSLCLPDCLLVLTTVPEN